MGNRALIDRLQRLTGVQNHRTLHGRSDGPQLAPYALPWDGGPLGRILGNEAAIAVYSGWENWTIPRTTPSRANLTRSSCRRVWAVLAYSCPPGASLAVRGCCTSQGGLEGAQPWLHQRHLGSKQKVGLGKPGEGKCCVI